MRETLEEILLIKESINEAHSISNEVSKKACELTSLFDVSLKNTNNKVSKYGVVILYDSFNITINNVNFTVYWELYNYYNKSIMTDVYGDIGVYGKVNTEKRTIRLHIPMISGKLDRAKVYDVIQHELSHAWENLHYGKQRKHQNMYQLSNIIMRDNSVNDYDYSIGTILYLCNDNEQRALCNGTYRFLMIKSDLFTLRDDVTESEQYKWFKQLKKANSLLKKQGDLTNSNQYLQYLKNNFNVSYKKLLKIGKETEDMMVRYIGRAIVKAQDDMLMDKNTHVYFNVRE